MTLSILNALATTFARRCLPALALGLAYIVLGPVLVARMIQHEAGPDGLDPGALDAFPFQVTYLIGGGLVLMMSVVMQGHAGVRRGAYVLPISTRLLGTWQIAASAVVVAATNLLVTFVLWRAIGVDWSYLGPTLFLATAAVVGHAIYWELQDFRVWKVFVAIGVVVGGSIWVSTRIQPGGRGSAIEPWLVTAVDGLLLGVAAVVAYGIALRALERDRHGRGRPDQRMQAVSERSDDGMLAFATSSRDVEHASGDRALAWFLFARTRLLGLGGACLLGLLLLIQAGRIVWTGTPIDLGRSIPMMSIGLIGVGWILGLAGLQGTLVCGRAGERLAVTIGTMPISDRTLARVVVTNTFRGAALATFALLLIALVPLGSSIATSGTASLTNFATRHGLGFEIIPIAIVGGLLMCWTSTALCTSIVAAGRPMLTVVYSIGVILLFVGSLMLLRLLPVESREPVRIGLVAMLAGVAVIGTLVAHGVALSRRLVGWGTPVVALSCWAVAAGLLAIFAKTGTDRGLLVGIASLAAMPFGTISLAVWRNRHR